MGCSKSEDVCLQNFMMNDIQPKEGEIEVELSNEGVSVNLLLLLF